ncbi:MAG: hypothetical protein ACUVTO_01155 [Candidatus Caldatribacteriaceae bacterium]
MNRGYRPLQSTSHSGPKEESSRRYYATVLQSDGTATPSDTIAVRERGTKLEAGNSL